MLLHLSCLFWPELSRNPYLKAAKIKRINPKSKQIWAVTRPVGILNSVLGEDGDWVPFLRMKMLEKAAERRATATEWFL